MLNKLFLSLKEKRYFIFICFLAFVNFFFFLDKLPVFSWDEARHGISAYEMVKSGNFVGHTYLETPDYWNLKPPLGLWFISFAYKIFGFSIFSLRFFSAFFAFISVLLCFRIFKHFFGENVAFISSSFLSLSNAYVHLHSGRTGDFDAIFSFIFVLTVYTLVFKKEDILKFLYLGLLIASGFLVKSFAFIQIVILIFLYYYLNRNLKVRKIFVIIIFFLIPVLIWAYLRYQYDGIRFFKSMFGYDFLSRSKIALEGHPSTNLHYLEPLILNNLFWSLFLIPAFIYRNELKINLKGEFSFYLKVNEFLSHPIVISWLIASLLIPFMVKTKCAWYVNSAHPVMALIASWYIVNNEKLNYKKWICWLLLFNFLAIWVRTFFLNEESVYREIKEQKPLLEMVKNFEGEFYFDPDNALQADIFILEVIGRGKIYKNENGIIFTKNFNNFKNVKIITNFNGWYVIQK
ncbi:MAG: glycosyltransferase family 39 protein [Brevinematales bacterium]|nr:glycosyltransferase family 39 protein [Brevinematales bacterium]